MALDTPAIAKAMYASNTYAGNTLGQVFGNGRLGALQTQNQGIPSQNIFRSIEKEREHDLDRIIQAALVNSAQFKQEIKPMAAATTPKTTRRLVKVIIMDPDEMVPLDDCILYSGEEKLTDLTDQELFFEVEIKELLSDHNEMRKGIVNKSIKERTEYLEPIKVRDLKMVVVDIAVF